MHPPALPRRGPRGGPPSSPLGQALRGPAYTSVITRLSLIAAPNSFCWIWVLLLEFCWIAPSLRNPHRVPPSSPLGQALRGPAHTPVTPSSSS